MLDEAKEEQQTVYAIKYDVGYDILTEHFIKERQPTNFCMSIPNANMAAGFNDGNLNIKEFKVKKQAANKSIFKRMIAILKKD